MKAIGDWLRSLVAPAAAEGAADWNTAGGDDHDDGPEPTWDGGRYLGARWVPAHPGRVGRAINPWAVVVHTTDMHPSPRTSSRSTFGALVRAWKTKPGAGNGAHFILGRTPEDGLVQMVDIGRNGNHAGGQPRHGWFEVGGKLVHPNLVSVGIEVHNAGLLVRVNDRWRTWTRDGGRLVPTGLPIRDADVEPDPKRKDRGWHRPTEYQFGELDRLIRAIAASPVTRPYPASWSVKPSGEAPAWAPKVIHGLPVVGHVTLDPARKTDPGLPLSRWLAGL